jgi:hypothetical protein
MKMERRLFRVSFRNVSGFFSENHFYVIAKDFNQAAIKAKEAFSHDQETRAMITNDGSLNKEQMECKISNIEFLTENVLL